LQKNYQENLSGDRDQPRNLETGYQEVLPESRDFPESKSELA